MALGAVVDGRGTVVVAASADAVARGAHAGDLVKIASATMGGGGGGKPGMAQGGGPDASALCEALAAMNTSIESVR